MKSRPRVLPLPEVERPCIPPAPAAGSDEVLAAAAAESDAAFDEIFRRYAPRVRRFVACQAGAGPDTVEELTQEVFLQVYRSLPGFAGRSSFRTWLYGLANNVCRHHRRRRTRRLRWFRAMGEDGPGLDQVPDLAPDAAERLARRELRSEVRRQVALLPAPYRSALLLRDWEELSYAEIAEVLAVPVGTVRSRLHQARARLAMALAPAEDEVPEENHEL